MHKALQNRNFVPKEMKKEKRIYPKSSNLSIFVGKVEKEVQNIRMKTTVNDVINALLRDKSDLTKPQSASEWVIVECWRGVERPLPPKTRLLKVWFSWRDEKSAVKFYLKRAHKTSSSHRTRSHGRRHRRLQLQGQEFFIDGPCTVSPEYDDNSAPLLTSSSSSGSSSNSTQSGGTSTTPNESSTSSDSDSTDEIERKVLLAKIENNECTMKDVLIDICNLDVQLEALENYHTISEIQHGTEEAKEQVHLIEERISSVNNIVHGLNSAIERHTKFRNSQPRRLDDPELCQIRSWLQMNIEAQLYLNLNIAAQMDQVSFKLGIIDQSIDARNMLLIDTFNPTECKTDEDAEISDVDSVIGLDYISNTPDKCEDCPDCRLGTPIHIKTHSFDLKSNNKMINYTTAESESSFSDSAIYSVTSKSDHLRQSLV